MRLISVAVASAAALLILTGCLTFASNDELAIMECEGLGLTFGTPDYAACYQRARARFQAADDAALGRILDND